MLDSIVVLIWGVTRKMQHLPVSSTIVLPFVTVNGLIYDESVPN